MYLIDVVERFDMYDLMYIHFSLSLSLSLCTNPAGRFDVDAQTNVEIRANIGNVGGFAYIGTGDGNLNSDAGFKAIGNGDSASAKILGTQRVDIDTKTAGGTNVEVNCGVSDINLCNIP